VRIALVSPYDLRVPGGVQGQVLQLADRLGARGHDVVVRGPGRGIDGPVVGWRTNDSVAPIALTPSAWRQASRAGEGVDVVHVHEPFMPSVGLGALGTATPVVATFHADPPPRTRRLYRRFAPLWRHRLGQAIATAVSPVAAEGVRLAGVETRIIPNGVDVPGEVAVPSDRSKTVAFLGRDEWRKGLDDLLEAWDRLRGDLGGWELVVAGTRRPDRPGVRFVGRISDAERASLLDRASVLCAPNRRGESFGLVVAEGLAHGCAVVASDLPAFREVAGDAALFAAPADVAALYDALAMACTEPALRAELATSGRAAVRRFHWDEVVDAYEQAYADAVD
jgi:phosphatidylinositol alpha-mannosyltransferase